MKMEDFVLSDDDYSYYENDDHDDDDESLDVFQALDGELLFPMANGPSCKVITKETLLSAQKEDLQRVMDLLSLKEHHARTLLIHYRWDVEKVMAILVEDGKDKLCAGAGVPVIEHALSQISSTLLCSICFEDVAADEATAMDCGHCFCNNCWIEHFIVKINEGQSRHIKCMTYKCNTVCGDSKIRCLVGGRYPSLAEKFDRFLLESYIEDNRRVKWCPSVPHCGNAIRIEEDELCEVECACGVQFCFSCLSEAHSPCSCLMWKLWSKKCHDESETVNWITIHTKPCPKCHKLVEKNGGCNLVCCVCGQAFCWLCGSATSKDHTWTTIVDHSCGRYKEDCKKKVEAAKRSLDRYIHYHSRYKAHADSFKLEFKLEEAIQEKITKLEDRESTSKDFSWVMNGLYRLFRSRRILCCTYPFAYYMFGDDLFKDEITEEQKELKKNLFEDQQQQFEANVEKLSSFLEEKFDEYTEDQIRDLRMRIISLSVSIGTLCQNMYDCIENDLLGSLTQAVHRIAPYHSNGVEKASKLPSCWDTDSGLRC